MATETPACDEYNLREETMNFFRSLRDLASVILMLQWAWHLGAYGHERLGVVGAVLGVMFSAPLIAISPFTAWLFMDRAQAIWFYLLLSVIVVCAAVVRIFKPRIYDEHGQEVG